MECDTLCVCCGRLDEDGTHIFLKCKQVRELWSRLELEELRDQLCTLPDAIAVVQKLLEETPDKLVQICCVL
jgi:hypothetical protein